MAKPLVEQCLDLAWSQWAALGVSGSGVLVPRYAVDLEAAIAFAPCLEDLDPRLHAEILDWCIHFARDFTSVSVLKQVLDMFDPEHRAAFERFAAIVNSQGGTKWPTSEKPRAFTPSNKSACKLERPSSIGLRARKIFGINARADILVALALIPPPPMFIPWRLANDLTDLGYTKRNLSEALNDLRAGGMLDTMPIGNTIRYALSKPDPLRAILAPMPESPRQPWAQRLAIAASLLDADRRTRGKSATTRAVEVGKLLQRKSPILERGRIPILERGWVPLPELGRIPRPELGTGDPWPELEAWMEPMLCP